MARHTPKYGMICEDFFSIWVKFILAFLMLYLITSCTNPPSPTPKTIFITKEVRVTQHINTPTPRVVVATQPLTRTPTPAPYTPTEARSHEWADYGGICIREDNLPVGVQLSSDTEKIRVARTQLLSAMWRTIEKSGAAADLKPSFSSYDKFDQGILSGASIRGPFVPVGKALPRSDPWSFYLEEADILWRKTKPDGSFNGVSLDIICLEFIKPLEFDKLKRQQGSPPYIHLIGGMSHAIFSLEEILGSPRLLIKLYQSPLSGSHDYPELLGFLPSNTPEENALTANQHVSAVVLTLNHTLWGNYDSDGELEFGYGPANSALLPLSEFETIKIFTPKP